MTVDRVFTSMPCSRALVAKVCRKSWKRAAGQPARFSTADSFFRTAAGSSGESSFLGDGNIHREEILFRYRSRMARIGAGRRMLRLEARVLGWETTSFPWMR